MGVAGLWEILQPAAKVVALDKLATNAFDENKGGHRALRVGVDASLWIFHSRTVDTGENPRLRVLFFKILHLLRRPLLPVFVFDGPNKPAFKRNSKVGGSWGTNDRENVRFKQLLDIVGLERWDAPGEAEAELAHMSKQGLIDAVLSDDVDSLLFGATCVLRNSSGTLSQNVGATSVNSTVGHLYQVYRSDAVQDHFKSLGGEITSAAECTDSMVLIAMLSGGDYLPAGLEGCGPKIALALALAGHHKLLSSYRDDQSIDTADVVSEMADELETNTKGFLSTRRKALAGVLRASPTFPRREVIKSYLFPAVSPPGKGWKGFDSTIDKNRGSLEGLALACEKYFEWGNKDIVARKFRTCGPYEVEAVTILRRRVLDRDGVSRGVKVPIPVPTSSSPPASTPRDTITSFFSQSSSTKSNKASATAPVTAQLDITRITLTRTHAKADMQLEYRVEILPTHLVRRLRSAMKGTRPDPLMLSKAEREKIGLVAVGSSAEADAEGEGDVEEDGGVGGSKNVDAEAPLKLWILDRLVEKGSPEAITAWETAQREKELRKTPKKKKDAAPKANKAKAASQSKSSTAKASGKQGDIAAWLSQKAVGPSQTTVDAESSDDDFEILEIAPAPKPVIPKRPPPSVSSGSSSTSTKPVERVPRKVASPTKTRRLSVVRPVPPSRSPSAVIDLSLSDDSDGTILPANGSASRNRSMPNSKPKVTRSPSPRKSTPLSSPPARYRLLSCDSDEEEIDCT